MEWNQPPRKKIVPECVGEISSTKECCAVDREEKEAEEDGEVLIPVVCRRELDVPPHGVVSGSAPTWYPLGTYGQAQWHVATLAVEQQSRRTEIVCQDWSVFLVIFSFSKAVVPLAQKRRR